MSDNVFNQQPGQSHQTEPAATAPTSNPLNDLLAGIKNEQGVQKYGTVEDALKGASHAQGYIQQLQQELNTLKSQNQELFGKATKVEALEQTVQNLMSKFGEPATQPNPATVGLDQTAVQQMLQVELQKQEAQKSKQANQKLVSDALSAQYGADAGNYLSVKAQETGMSVEEIADLASKSPTAAITLLGLKQVAQSKPQTQYTQGSVNTAGLQPTPDSFIGRNPNSLSLGFTTQDLMAASERAQKMTEELAAQGKSVYDLTNPSLYFKHFN